MSGFLRDAEHGIFYAQSLLAHWAGQWRAGAERGRGAGRRQLQGAAAVADRRARPRRPGDAGRAPRARIYRRRPPDMAFPLLVKANIGGSGAGIVRYDDAGGARGGGGGALPARERRQGAAAPGLCARAGRAGSSGSRRSAAGSSTRSRSRRGGGFDLCPADACVAAPGRAAIRMAAVDPRARADRGGRADRRGRPGSMSAGSRL